MVVANNEKHPQMNLLLTRPLAGAEAFWNAFPDDLRQKLHPIFSPLMEIKRLSPNIPERGGVIFSSANGVKNSPNGNGRYAFCVGAMTTRSAMKAGWNARQLGETADQLVENLITEAPEAPLFHLGGQHTRGDIAGRLSCAGISTRHIVVYDQVLCGLTQEAHETLSGKFPLLLPLFSPRSGSNFIEQCRGHTSLHVVAMSDEVANAIKGLICSELIIAKRPTREMMVQAIQMVAFKGALG